VGLTSLLDQSHFRTSFASSLKVLSTFSTVACKHISRVYARELFARQCTYEFLLFRFVCEGVAAETPAGLLEAIYLLLNPLDVFETQFVLDDFHVADRINVSLDVDHFCIVEGADDLEDAIDSTHVREERVP
jgi:hypothetical protein